MEAFIFMYYSLKRAFIKFDGFSNVLRSDSDGSICSRSQSKSSGRAPSIHNFRVLKRNTEPFQLF